MKPIYEFGVFRLDPAERLLLRGGQPVSLTPKAFDLVVYLVEHQGRLVEKATLMAALWPDSIVEETNLAFQISALRKVLDDGGNGETLIQTVPTKGYRFIAPVTVSQPAVPAHWNRRLLAGAALLLLVGASAIWLMVKPSPPATAAVLPTAPVFTQLTANPAEVPVDSQAMSPDGKYLAYADRTGIQVEVIDRGEVQALPETRGMAVLGWSDDGTKIRTIKENDGPVRTIWDVSLVGSARRRTGLVWPDGGISLAPDDSCFLKLMPDGELRVEPVHGTARGVLRLVNDDSIRSAVWTPDAKRVLFVRSEGAALGSGGLRGAALETFAVGSGGPSVVFTAPRGQVIRVLGPPGRDGRLIALMGLRDNKNDNNIWEIRTDTRTGLLVGEPRRLTDWREQGCHQITRSADGRRVALLTATRQLDVYVAAFDEHAARLDTPRRLTMSDRDDYPTAWAPDNRHVIFSSTRAGRQVDIYQQDIDGKEPQLLVTGDDDKGYPRVTGDGRWILFFQWPFSQDSHGPTRVMRAPIEGGIAEEVYASPGQAVPQCSISKGCIVYEYRGDKGVISSLDPIRGKGAELVTVPTSESGYISPDGTEFAYIVDQDQPRNHIRIISFVGRPPREITVAKAGALANLDWLPDGSGWISVNITEPYNQLLYVLRDGRSHVLWAPDRTSVSAGTPSRDGKHLAISTYTTAGNAWMMTGF